MTFVNPRSFAPLFFLMVTFLTGCFRSDREIAAPLSVPCGSLTNNGVHDSASFRGIVPGVSTQKEVGLLFGEPSDRHLWENGIATWYFEDVAIDIQGGYVVGLSPYTITESLDAYITDFGCPNGIYRFFGSDENTEGSLLLVFSDRGLSLTFSGIYVKLSDIPINSYLFIPTDLSGYLEQNPILKDESDVLPVKWEDNVIK